MMLDRDLAVLYGVETRVLNQAVRRNRERFPADFMFSLDRKEIMDLSQIVISSKMKHSPNVFVFTEQGIAMLSSVLNSRRAVLVNIQIMRAFAGLREMLSSHEEIRNRIEAIEKKYDDKFKVVFDAIKTLIETPIKKSKIGFLRERK